VIHFHESGPRQGRAVVLLHGIGGNGSLWRANLPALEGLWALAWDMPGYGRSAPLRGGMSFPTLAKALCEALDAVGVARVDLLGHSMGGMVAVEFALAFPERVRSLVLAATSAAFGSADPAFREGFLRMRQAPLDAGLGMAAVAEELVPTMLGEDPDPAAAPTAAAVMREVPEPAYRAALACLTGFDRRADLPRITAPALVIAGGADRVAPPRGMKRMADAIPGAHFHVVEGAGHLLPLERPREFNEEVSRFLATVPE
jgi:pimeloyl-ACP methyl ester carboxylesterase